MFHDRNLFISHNKSWTPLYVACMRGKLFTCQLLCALDGVDQNAVNNEGETALDMAINRSQVDCVRALLEFNVDTTNAAVDAETRVEIAQLFEEHRKRSVKKKLFERNFNLICYFQEIERIAIRNRVLEESRAKIQKYFKFEVVK